MIINAQKSDVELIGDIKEFKTSIDPKNLEFITTLLSSNLYSKPEQSFIREIVSNAWDSQVEAGNTDTPVLINIDDKNKSITIRDFGVGLSPERFEKIYCNIGSSTKRDSNDFIGGFGLGRFSSLACTNVVYITSYYKGKSYHYIMTKSGNNITTNLVTTLDTKEKDGVEVTIKDLYDMTAYYNSLEYIVFFPNIYVDSINANYINDTKIKRFNNFAVASRITSHKLLLGNVLYPCDVNQLNQEARSFLCKIKNTGIVISFNIGELNITPNRENVIYTKDTIDIIEDRIQKAKEEMYSIIRSVYSNDYDNLENYYKVLWCNSCIDFLNNDTEYKITSFTFKLSEVNTITYKGKDLSSKINFIQALCRGRSYNIKGAIKFCTYKKNPGYSNTNFSSKSISLKKEQKITSYVRKYLEEKYNNYLIITECTLDEFKKYYSEEYKMYKDFDNFDYILEEAYNLMISNTTYIDFKNNQDFIAYKQYIKDNSDKSSIIRNIILYEYSGNEYIYKIPKRFDTLFEAIKYIKNIKKGIVFDNISENNQYLSEIICARGYIYITANIPTMNELYKINFTNRINKDWVLNKDEMLQIIYTISKYFPKSNNLLNRYIPDIFPKEISNYLKEICKIYINIPYSYYNYACKVSDKEHPYYSYICKKVYDYLYKYNKVKEEFSYKTYLDSFSEDILYCYIMKSKLFKINYNTYSRLKSNKILNVLCRK